MNQLLAPELVGRDDALEAVEQLLLAAGQGTGGVLVVRGEPGIGKSRLVRAAAEIATRAGMAVFSGRTTPVGAPFRAFTSAFLPYGRDHPRPAAPELVPFRKPLSIVVPDWAEVGSTGAEAVRQAAAPLVAEGLTRLLRLASATGSLLALEDVHWADPESLQVLDHLADSAAQERLAIIVTMRSEEGTAAGWASAACARRAAKAFELHRLPEHDTIALIHSCLRTTDVPRELVELVADASEGLPLLVEDLLAGLVDSGAVAAGRTGWEVTRSLHADVPRTFAQSVEERLGLLDARARRVLVSAAVVGRRFDWQVLAEATGEPVDVVMEALRAGVDSQLVAPDPVGGPHSFRFRHALTREAVLQGLLPPERTSLAAAAARAVERARPDLPADWLSIAAALHAEGGRPDHAARLLLEEGRRALGSGALPSAEAALRHARRLATQSATADAVDAALTDMLALAGRVDEATVVGEALLARRSSDRLADEVRLRLARAAVAAGSLEQADRHSAAVTASVAELPVAGVLRATIALARGSVVQAEQQAHDALHEAEGRGEWAVACEALEVLGRLARTEHATRAEQLFERAQRIAERHDLALWRGRALHQLGTIDLMESGRPDRLEAARAEAARDGDLATVAHVDLHLGVLRAHRGDAEAARLALESAAQLAASIGLGDLERVSTAQLAYAHALDGQRSAALVHVESVRRVARQDDARLLVDGLAEPFCLLLEDDVEAAARALDRTVTLLTGGSWPQWGLWALLHAVVGRDDAIAQARERAGVHGPQRLVRAYLEFAQAVSLGRCGDRQAAAAHFAEADEALGWQSAHRPFCYRLVAAGALRDGWGDPLAWLRTSVEALPEAPDFSAACRRLIREAGAPVPRKGRGDATVPAGLRRLGVTSREMDVLILVADGLGNPAIAERLHLSRRTVESHVGRLLAKTGRGSRADLVALANSVRPTG